MITVNDLSFDYPGKRALCALSFEIPAKSITALVGPNGAGKTTLLRCLAALEAPTLGYITISQWDVEKAPRQIHRICGYLSDFFGLYDELTIEQHLKFFALNHKMPTAEIASRINTVLTQLDLKAIKDKTAGSLSRGQRQKLGIAQAILPDPKVLLLDEPAAGLDPKARHELSQLLIDLKARGMTIIVSSHILAELEDYCTHMMVIDDGKCLKHLDVQETQSTSKQSLQDIYLALMKKDS